MCIVHLEYFVLIVIVLGIFDLIQDVLNLVASPMRPPSTDDFNLLDDAHI